MIALIIHESALLSDLELSSKHSDFTSHVPMHIAKLHKQDYSGRKLLYTCICKYYKI